MKKLSLLFGSLLGFFQAVAQPMPDAEPTNIASTSVDGLEFYVLAVVLISLVAYTYFMNRRRA